jgi:hypothetical protein
MAAARQAERRDFDMAARLRAGKAAKDAKSEEVWRLKQAMTAERRESARQLSIRKEQMLKALAEEEARAERLAARRPTSVEPVLEGEETGPTGPFYCDRCDPDAEKPPLTVVCYRRLEGDFDLCEPCYTKMTNAEQKEFKARAIRLMLKPGERASRVEPDADQVLADRPWRRANMPLRVLSREDQARMNAERAAKPLVEEAQRRREHQERNARPWQDTQDGQRMVQMLDRRRRRLAVQERTGMAALAQNELALDAKIDELRGQIHDAKNRTSRRSTHKTRREFKLEQDLLQLPLDQLVSLEGSGVINDSLAGLSVDDLSHFRIAGTYHKRSGTEPGGELSQLGLIPADLLGDTPFSELKLNGSHVLQHHATAPTIPTPPTYSDVPRYSEVGGQVLKSLGYEPLQISVLCGQTSAL